jgi:hypothetical protein
VTHCESLEKYNTDMNEGAFDVALVDGRLMESAFLSEKDMDDDGDDDDDDRKRSVQQPEASDRSSTDLEAKINAVKSLRELCAKGPVVLMQRDKDEGANSDKLNAIHLTTTTATAGIEHSSQNNENENETSNNDNNNNNSSKATFRTTKGGEQQDLVIRAIHEGVCDVIRYPLVRQNSANLWQHCVRNMLKDSGNVKMAEVLKRSGIATSNKKLLAVEPATREDNNNDNNNNNNHVNNGSDDSSDDTMPLKSSGSNDNNDNNNKNKNKNNNNDNNTIDQNNEFTGAVVKVPSKTKGKRSQRKFANRAWSVAATNAQFGSSFDVHPNMQNNAQIIQHQQQPLQQQPLQPMHHNQYTQQQMMMHPPLQQQQVHHVQQPPMQMQQVQHVEQPPMQMQQRNQSHNPMDRMPSLQKHVGILPKAQRQKLSKAKEQQKRLAIKPAHIIPVPGPGDQLQRSWVDQNGRVFYHQAPQQPQLVQIVHPQYPQQQQQHLQQQQQQQQQHSHHYPQHMQQYPQHQQYPQVHRVEALQQFSTSVGLNGSPVRAHPYPQQLQYQRLQFENLNAGGSSPALFQQGQHVNFSAAAAGGPPPQLPLGLKLTKSNSLKDLLRAHEVERVNRVTTADLTNANDVSSNDSPTTIATNEDALLTAFGDDDEDILSLTNMPDNVDLNDLNFKLDEEYLVF